MFKMQVIKLSIVQVIIFVEEIINEKVKFNIL